jgi:hypothetical protein
MRNISGAKKPQMNAERRKTSEESSEQENKKLMGFGLDEAVYWISCL